MSSNNRRDASAVPNHPYFIIDIGTKLKQRFVCPAGDTVNQENEEMVPHGRPLRISRDPEIQG